MAAYVCAIAGGKGGVGKTTTVINLGAALHQLDEHVVVVDADLGMPNLAALLGVDVTVGVHDVLAGDAQVRDALLEREEGPDVLPGSQSLDAFADADPANLGAVIEALRQEYDVVLVDSEAGVSHSVAVPLGRADGVVLVVTPDDVAVGDALKTAQLADRIDGTVLGAVVNRVTDPDAVDDLRGALTAPTLAVVPEDSAAGDEPLVVHAPDSPAAAAFGAFAGSLLSVFAGDASPGDVEPPIEDDWFDGSVTLVAADADEGADAGADTADAPESADDDDDDDEVFGLFN